MHSVQRLGMAAVCALIGIIAVQRVAVPDETRRFAGEAAALAALMAGAAGASASGDEGPMDAIGHVMQIAGVGNAYIIDDHGAPKGPVTGRIVGRIDEGTAIALRDGRRVVHRRDDATLAAFAPSAGGGGAVVEMSPPQRCIDRGAAMWMVCAIVAAALAGGAFPRKRRGIKAAAPARDDRSGDIPIGDLERLADAAVFRLDEGRRIIEAGPRGVAVAGAVARRGTHLIDVFGADDAQILLKILRRTATAGDVCDSVSICRAGMRVRAIKRAGFFLMALARGGAL